MTTRNQHDYPLDFGELVVAEAEDGWITPVLGALAFGAWMLMLMTGTAPWQ